MSGQPYDLRSQSPVPRPSFRSQSPVPRPSFRTQSPVPPSEPDQAAIRGITNDSGANNCFLNCTVQALWNCDAFRSSFVLIKEHTCTGDSCIFCSLTVLAAHYQHDEEGPVAPDILRTALAQSHSTDNRFQIGLMADAAECLEEILHNLHVSLTDSTSESLCVGARCISHRLFSMTLVEQDKCMCGASSEPLTFDQFTYYVSVSALAQTHSEDPTLNFGALLQRATLSARACPEGKCSNRPARLEVSMLEKPDIFCVGLAWPGGEERKLVEQLSECAEEDLDLDELFENVASTRSNVYRLVGVMCYYGYHYFTFFRHSGVDKWLLYDDATVKEVGTEWEDVRKTLVKGKYQPLVMLYANPTPEKSFAIGLKQPEINQDSTVRIRKDKNRLRGRLACFSPASPVSTKQKKHKITTAETLRRDSLLERRDSLLESPCLPDKTNLFDSVVSGVEDKISSSLSFLGLKDGDKVYKKKFINDCMKQGDDAYFEAKKALIVKEYTKALELAIDATNLYLYILQHEDATLSQRQQAKLKYETGRLKCKRISRRIPISQITRAQLAVLYERCSRCDSFREDDMPYCADCTRYCTACKKPVSGEGVVCEGCCAERVLAESLAERGQSASDVQWYEQGALCQLCERHRAVAGSEFCRTCSKPPPPYESLRRTKCIICSRHSVTNFDICSYCSQAKE